MKYDNPVYLRHPYVYADFGRGTACIENSPRNIASLLYLYRNETVVISSPWGVSLITMKHGLITRCYDKTYLYTRLYITLAYMESKEINLKSVITVDPHDYLIEDPFHWLKRYWSSLKKTQLTLVEKIRQIRYEIKRVEAPSPYFACEEDVI